MKHRIIYFALSLAAAVSFASACNDNLFLEEQPKTIFTVDNAFSKSSQVDAQLARTYYASYSLYAWIDGNIFGAFGGSPSSTLLGYGSDTIEGNAANANAGSAFSNYASLDALNGRFLNLWNALYQLASYANLAVYGADQVSWNSEAEKSDLLSQAKFFVGYSYLRLAECFGSVPLVEEFNQDLRYDYTRTPRKEVYDFAIKMLSEAAAGLPDYPAADGRIAKGAANHFLAEAYLAQGVETGDASNFDKAIAAANVTIGLHPLMTTRFGIRANPADKGTAGVPNMFNIPNYREDGTPFYDLFQVSNYDRSAGNTESLWVLQTPTYDQRAAANSGQSNNSIVGCAQPYRDLVWADPYKENGAGNGPWAANADIDMNMYPFGSAGAYCGGGSWGMFGSNDYIDEDIWQGEFATDDRNNQNILLDPVCMDRKHSLYNTVIKKEMLLEPARYMRISGKVNLPDSWGFDSHCIIMGQGPQGMFGRDIYAARSSETYLLLAEAQLRKGNADEAAKAINTVRARAHASKMFSAGEISIVTILDERARELAWEEHRWPTLLRLAKEGETNTIMQQQLAAHAQYVHDNPVFAGTSPKWSLFPIPLSVIQMNTDAELPQNQGW